MQGEITRKNVLLECLSIMRQELAVCSKHYNGLEPKEGMEEAWEQGRRKVQILQEMIHAYESEPVRRALADWQKDVMENGPRALDLEVQEPEICPYFKENFGVCELDKTYVCRFAEKYRNCGWYKMKKSGRPVLYEG